MAHGRIRHLAACTHWSSALARLFGRTGKSRVHDFNSVQLERRYPWRSLGSLRQVSTPGLSTPATLSQHSRISDLHLPYGAALTCNRSVTTTMTAPSNCGFHSSKTTRELTMESGSLGFSLPTAPASRSGWQPPTA